MADVPWVVASYALTWIVLGSYAFIVHRRLGRARAEREAEVRRSNTRLEVES